VRLSSRVRPWSGRAATVFDPLSDLDQASVQPKRLFRDAIKLRVAMLRWVDKFAGGGSFGCANS